MAKKVRKTVTCNHTVFSDLEKFTDFCRMFGYRFNPANLYNMRSTAYQQYTKYSDGKSFRDQAGYDLASTKRR